MIAADQRLEQRRGRTQSSSWRGREYVFRGRGYVQELGATWSAVVLKVSGPNGVPVLIQDLGSVRFGPDIRRGLAGMER